jgi:hypothetical protein
MSPRAAAWEPPYVDVSVGEGPVDLAPSTGTDVDWEDEELTADEVEVGEQLGEAIDPDDDTDNGGIPTTEPEPGQSVLPPLDVPVEDEADGAEPEQPGGQS